MAKELEKCTFSPKVNEWRDLKQSDQKVYDRLYNHSK